MLALSIVLRFNYSYYWQLFPKFFLLSSASSPNKTGTIVSAFREESLADCAFSLIGLLPLCLCFILDRALSNLLPCAQLCLPRVEGKKASPCQSPSHLAWAILSDLLSAIGRGSRVQMQMLRALGHRDPLNLPAVGPRAPLSVSLLTHEMGK